MKTLSNILSLNSTISIFGNSGIVIEGITLDSRKVEKGFLFIALEGSVVDGNLFIPKAISNGAVAILTSKSPKQTEPEITYIVTENIGLVAGEIAHKFYNKPSNLLEVIGVTGTNGKTTITTLLFNLFTSLGYKCGLIGTIQNQIQDRVIQSQNTTPNVVELHQLLAEMAEADCDFVFMEVSSHAVHQKRIAGVNFKGGVFTNLTHDHLDYHKTFDAYRDAKKEFFDNLPSDAFALSNNDDKNGKYMLQNTKATKYYYSVENGSDFKIKIIDYDLLGMQLSIDNQVFFTPITGKFNASNLAVVYAVSILTDQAQSEVLNKLTDLKPVEGRFSCVYSPNGIIGLIDYAHTPDALENVLQSIKEVTQPNNKIITVVGCGGDRDREKRPKMAKIAVNYSNKVILTADNPRSEKPEDIIHEMSQGVQLNRFKDVLSITDRKQAIRTACALASKGDIILVAGKGHEKYQEILGEKLPFNDFEVLGNALNENKTIPN